MPIFLEDVPETALFHSAGLKKTMEFLYRIFCAETIDRIYLRKADSRRILSFRKLESAPFDIFFQLRIADFFLLLLK